MTTAIVENGKVINVILGQIEGSIEIPEGFGIGDLYENGEFIKAPIVIPEPEPIQVPQMITPRQFRLQLLNLGLLDEVEAMASVDKATQIWFEYSLDFQRNHEMLLASASALDLSSEDLDTFFIEASKL